MDIVGKPWTKRSLPKRILAIRLQAMGDVVITLPYLQDLRNNLPASVQIDLLTRMKQILFPGILSYLIRFFQLKGKEILKSMPYTQYFYCQHFYFGVMIL
jgi:ADP-heptose:LPS heptosyltransferase